MQIIMKAWTGSFKYTYKYIIRSDGWVEANTIEAFIKANTKMKAS